MARPEFVLAACGMTLWLAAPASAQYPSPFGGYGTGYRPNLPYNPAPPYGVGYQQQLSPFLNLLRGGDPASNYYLGTVPEQQRRANTAAFGAAIGQLSQQQRIDRAQQQRGGPDADLFAPLPTTGHPVAFQNLGGYFNQTGGRRVAPTRPAQPLQQRR